MPIEKININMGGGGAMGETECVGKQKWLAIERNEAKMGHSWS